MRCGSFNALQFLRGLVEDLTAKLEKGVPPPRTGGALMVMMLLALDLFVVSAAPADQRLVGWMRLVKVWVALRQDDTCGISPRSFRVADGVFIAELERSKTSGPGRDKRHVNIYIAGGAFICKPGAGRGP